MYKDWQIAEEAEKSMLTPRQWQEKLGLADDEIFYYGKVAKLNYVALMERWANQPLP